MKRINKACLYYPCHKKLEDCTFCWCAFYPCLNKSLGNFVYSSKKRKDVWSCRECSWIHKKDVVDDIFKLVRKNKRVMPELNPSKRKTGAIVLSHGSRMRRANGRVKGVIELAKKRTKLSLIEPAHLQLSEPAFSKSVRKLAEKGCRKIVIVPFFLLSGNHVKRDIPKVLKEAKARYPRIRFVYTKELGMDNRVVDVVAERIIDGCRK